MYRGNVILSNGSVASPYGIVPGQQQQQQRPVILNSMYRFGQQSQQATYRTRIPPQAVSGQPLRMPAVPTGYGSLPYTVKPAPLVPTVSVRSQTQSQQYSSTVIGGSGQAQHYSAVRSQTQQFSTGPKPTPNVPICVNILNNNVATGAPLQQAPVENEQIRRVILQKANIHQSPGSKTVVTNKTIVSNNTIIRNDTHDTVVRNNTIVANKTLVANNTLVSNSTLVKNINLVNNSQIAVANLASRTPNLPQQIRYANQYNSEILKQIDAKRNQLIAQRYYNRHRFSPAAESTNQKENVNFARLQTEKFQGSDIRAIEGRISPANLDRSVSPHGSERSASPSDPDQNNSPKQDDPRSDSPSDPEPSCSSTAINRSISPCEFEKGIVSTDETEEEISDMASKDYERPQSRNSRPSSRNSDSNQNRTSGSGKRRAESPHGDDTKRVRGLQWGQGVDNDVAHYQNPAYAGTTKASQDMLDYFLKNHQTESALQKKMELRDALLAIITAAFPYCSLYIVGSSMSGFGTMSSDMDLCLSISDQHIDQTKEAPEILYHIKKALASCTFLKDVVVIKAKVPILRFTDKISEVECDVNVNNIVGIRNTHLLRYYSQVDWRVRPMVLFAKKWARFHDINDASKATISSYSLSLMIIHYLQCGCSPPVLPSLQKLHPNLFAKNIDIRNLKMNHQMDFKVQNRQPLGDLFEGFLEYFTYKFNYDRDVISVRLGACMTKSLAVCQTGDDKSWKHLKIEEPFDFTNTARSCYDANIFERVKRVIHVSHRKLKQTGKMASLFEHPF
ncbi:uncharacterized protein LOC132547468 [Ylistrum balloti]|uniref:uncharacterized protein LOC132547468 n=1 Tax=Ylistrum balloti TaxID=509963 RepID=UPI0029059E1F|nr:uncharacterized protein LOC132547468 [Ylistrum balloti]XP_060067207.1 uncharacterized protein LOC132547468 [Ylistrum balloti]